MHFISVRACKGSPRTKVNRLIKFDLQINAPTNSLYCCVRGDKNKYTEIGAFNLFSQIATMPYKHILFYIHGSNSLPEEDIFPKCQILQKLFDKYDNYFVQIIPIIWPSDNDLGFVMDYWDDRMAADASAYPLSRLINKYYDWMGSYLYNPCSKSINILCHDLGCAVFEKTVNLWTENYGTGYFPMLFKNLFLVAGDIKNNIFREGLSGNHISTSSRNVVVYYSANDMVLSGTSKNLKLRPLNGIPIGLTGPIVYNDTPSNVKSIDCSDVSNMYDSPFGHNYFLTGMNNELELAGIVFDHIYETIRTGRVETKDGRINILSDN